MRLTATVRRECEQSAVEIEFVPASFSKAQGSWERHDAETGALMLNFKPMYITVHRPISRRMQRLVCTALFRPQRGKVLDGRRNSQEWIEIPPYGRAFCRSRRST
ncbi:unnamed protein product [Zymoseptoria tritici ST99CH_3D7]|uniref:Uncharacterized protein n=1 Tax=Zymoseptoria tritici (strain ST99CH_3D7) TaxID=1276538 RepID=A0A1X7S824_ZYMT9|nr:unnamed protein product [Zymoseptoria tritici ST99CH_3D7]